MLIYICMYICVVKTGDFIELQSVYFMHVCVFECMNVCFHICVTVHRIIGCSQRERRVDINQRNLASQRSQGSEAVMSQSLSSIYSAAPQDIPRHHAYIRHREDTVLCVVMENGLSVSPRWHFVAN